MVETTSSVPAWFAASAEDVVPETDSIRDEMPYGQRLKKYMKLSAKEDIAFLEYRTLHRINITNLQNKLAILKSSIETNASPLDEDLEGVRDSLHAYGSSNPDNNEARKS